MKKDELISFIYKRDIEIPNPILTKPMLLKNIRNKNLEKHYVLILWKKELAIYSRVVPVSLHIESHGNDKG